MPDTTKTIAVRISAAIDNEYANRLPEWLPESVDTSTGLCLVPVAVAKAMLSDALYNSDRQCVDVGPYGMPLGVFNAYKALAKQLAKALA